MRINPVSKIIFFVLYSLFITPLSSEADLPSLPLTDCATNSLPISDNVFCEGNVMSYNSSWPNLRYPSGSIPLTISSRAVDFRRADEIGTQIITLTLQLPVALEGTLDGFPNRTYKTAIKAGWPQYLDDDIYIERYAEGDSFWNGETGGASYTNDQNPARALLVRQGTCNGTSCGYAVNWGSYPHVAVYHPQIYRVCIPFSQTYVYKQDGSEYGVGNSCGTDPAGPSACSTLSGGESCVTFRVDPPPALKAVAKSSRIGSRQFSFDGAESGPEVTAYLWGLSFPAVSNSQAVFEYDFNQHPELSSGFSSTIGLTVTDKWKRTASTSAPFGFASGLEGDLEITSMTFTGLKNGAATYSITVKNKSQKTIQHVFLEVNRSPAGGKPLTSPSAVNIPSQGSSDFTISIPIDTAQFIFFDTQALGQGDQGPVKSAKKLETYDPGKIPGPGSTSPTPVSTGVPTTPPDNTNPNLTLLDKIKQVQNLLKSVKGNVSKKQKATQAEITKNLKNISAEIDTFIKANQGALTATSNKINFTKLSAAAKKTIAAALKRKDSFAADKKTAGKALTNLMKGIAA